METPVAYLVGLAVIALAIFSSRFRNIALFVLGLVVLFVFADYQREQSRDRAAKLKIHVEDLRFDGLRLKHNFGVWTVTGRATNSSEYPLASITMELTVRDCQSKDPNQCVVIGQDTRGSFDTIPPHQARDITIYFYPSPDPQPAGTMVWSYVVKEISAER